MAEFNGKEPRHCRGCGNTIKPFARVWRAALNGEAASSTECASLIDIATEDMKYAKKYIGQMLINNKGRVGLVKEVRPHKRKLEHALFGHGVDGKVWTARTTFSVIAEEDAARLKIAFMPPMLDMPQMPDMSFVTSEVKAATQGIEEAVDRMGERLEGVFDRMEKTFDNVFSDSLVDMFETDATGKRKKKKK